MISTPREGRSRKRIPTFRFYFCVSDPEIIGAVGWLSYRAFNFGAHLQLFTQSVEILACVVAVLTVGFDFGALSWLLLWARKEVTEHKFTEMMRAFADSNRL